MRWDFLALWTYVLGNSPVLKPKSIYMFTGGKKSRRTSILTLPYTSAACLFKSSYSTENAFHHSETSLLKRCLNFFFKCLWLVMVITLKDSPNPEIITDTSYSRLRCLKVTSLTVKEKRYASALWWERGSCVNNSLITILMIDLLTEGPGFMVASLLEDTIAASSMTSSFFLLYSLVIAQISHSN